MLGHTIDQMKPNAAQATRTTDWTISPELRRGKILVSIKEHQALSRRGLWGILSFLTLSAAALYCREANLLAMFPEKVRELLGAPPPTQLIHIAFAVSCVSALILILGRMTENGRQGYSWLNILMPTIFYPLYFFSDKMDKHFNTVFTAGMVILLVEHASIWLYSSKAMLEEKEQLKELSKGEGL
jgi:hypothetical protein